MHFLIKSVTNKGQTAFLLKEAPNYEYLLTILEQQKIIAISIQPLPKQLSILIPQNGKKISSDEIIELMENLHLIIKAGLPLYQGLMDLAQDSDNKRFEEMLLYIANSIHDGKSLSTAFTKYEDAVGTIILNLIKIGEETGQLETTLQRAATFLKRTSALKKKAKSALIYPSFAFAAVSSAMLVWMVYVLPQMTDLFKSMDLKLPPLTLAIMAISDFLNNYILYLIGAIILFIIAFKIAYKKSYKFRFQIDSLLLKIPIIKQIISGFNTAFISEYLRLALISGVPVFTALSTLTDNITNEPFKKALNETKENVAKGSQIATSLAKTKMFTPFTIRMIGVGESAGSLDAQLELIATYYYERVDYFAENIGKVIEPVVLIFVGGFMAVIVAGLMGPMYDLISNMK